MSRSDVPVTSAVDTTTDTSADVRDLHWQRCFIALTPATNTAAQLVLPATPGIRPVAQPSLHLTLAFIGDLPAASGRDLADSLPALARPLPALLASRIEWWPDSTRPRVLVASYAEDEELNALVEDVRAHLVHHGLPTGNAFRAHISLARAARYMQAEQAEAALRLARMPAAAEFVALTLYATRRELTAGDYWRAASTPLPVQIRGQAGE